MLITMLAAWRSTPDASPGYDPLVSEPSPQGAGQVPKWGTSIAHGFAGAVILGASKHAELLNSRSAGAAFTK